MIFVVVAIKKGNHTKNDDDGDTRKKNICEVQKKFAAIKAL